MFKFIHAADVHLDSPLHRLDNYEGVPIDEFRQATRRAFENLIRLAISENAAFVLIAGDLYDGDWKDYNTGLYLVSQLRRLDDADIPVFILAGNHDAASRISKTLRFPENVRLFSVHDPETYYIDTLNVAIHGQGFASPAVKRDLSKHYPNAAVGYFNIGLLHTCATGREGHENYAPCSVEGLSSKGYDYWALGHVHAYEMLTTDPLIVFSGNIQGRHVRETGPKGCVLVSVDDDGRADAMFRPLDVVRWEFVHVDAGYAESGYDIIDRVSDRIDMLMETNGDMPMALRVHIEGETVVCDEILSDVERWINEIRSLAIDSGNRRIWVEKVKFDLGLPISGQVPKTPQGAVGELLQLFDELQSDENGRRLLLEELVDLQRRLPRELKMPLESDSSDDTWLDDLMAQVRPTLVSRLLRKGVRNADR
jgi:DNA repair exonuclease SbcCD nuclease subunit